MDELEITNSPALRAEVRSILRCPSCRGALEDQREGLVCPICGKKFPLLNGVLRFVEAQHYAGSFGFQWLKHDRTQLDSDSSRRSEKDFTHKTGLTHADLEGKLVLDVGCGMGRYAEVVSRWGAHVVGIDLSRAVEAAVRNLKGRTNASVFQADVFALPFAPESFDYIYSLGVLHHTPDCARAFKTLPEFLKPGGGIAIWLYSGYHKWYRMSDVYRKITRRMPPGLLHKLCYLSIPLYWLHMVLRKVPLVGRAASGVLAYAFPMSFNRTPQWRVLDTFDWYSPWYQSKHTYEEVFPWFESCGIEDLHVAEVPVSVRGTKPSSRTRHEAGAEAEVARCAE